MFPCGICHTMTRPGEKATRIVTATRNASYPFRRGAHRFRKEKKRWIKDDPGGRGMEVVSEALACNKCAVAAGLMTLPPQRESYSTKVLNLFEQVAKEVKARDERAVDPPTTTDLINKYRHTPIRKIPIRTEKAR